MSILKTSLIRIDADDSKLLFLIFTPPHGHFTLIQFAVEISASVLKQQKSLNTLISVCFWRCWTVSVNLGSGSWCNSVQVHHSGVTSDPYTLKIDHFPSPLATQVERISPGHWVQSQQWPSSPLVSRASLSLLFLSYPKSKLTPFTDGTDRPVGPHQSFTHPRPAVPVPAGPPSHSAASNRKPAISNLTHFSDC